jgi:HEAT repeat protein
VELTVAKIRGLSKNAHATMLSRSCAIFGLLVAVAAGPAHAQLDGRLSFFARQLQKAKDPRVRAQNALALGLSKEAAAVVPLCMALNDESDLVRSSVAKAIGNLEAPSGIDCLKAHKDDAAGAVRSEIERSLALLQQAAAAHPPELYISMSGVTDKTSHLPPEVLQLTEEKIRARLQALGGVFAPDGETKAAARSVLKKQRLKGFMLRVELDTTPSGGLKVNLVCFTYPERNLLGEVNVKASGGKPADMIRAMAPKVIDEAADTFNWSS